VRRFSSLTSRVVALVRDDIDTDQIIPARFLVTTSREGLGAHLFHDWRYQPDGSPRADFPLTRPEAIGAQILLAGKNFGCGSSREHAPWALLDFGFRAVIARSFADIFRNNALKNGLLPVEVDEEAHADLAAAPEAEVTIDLETGVLLLPSGRGVVFPVDPFARRCLLAGTDQLGYLLGLEDRIAAFERRRGEPA
jgi:3-isopropylmalate/(R)-2-methylmalate dehydratase small subunit